MKSRLFPRGWTARTSKLCWHISARMLPSEAVVRAASRWLALLETSSFAEAGAILRANTEYSDLTYTQYSIGLEWLAEVGLLADGANGYVVTAEAARLSPE